MVVMDAHPRQRGKSFSPGELLRFDPLKSSPLCGRVDEQWCRRAKKGCQWCPPISLPPCLLLHTYPDPWTCKASERSPFPIRRAAAWSVVRISSTNSVTWVPWIATEYHRLYVEQDGLHRTDMVRLYTQRMFENAPMPRHRPYPRVVGHVLTFGVPINDWHHDMLYPPMHQWTAFLEQPRSCSS